MCAVLCVQEEAVASLVEHGVAVVRGVWSPTKAEQHLKAYLADFSSYFGINPDTGKPNFVYGDPSTYKFFLDSYQKHAMLFQHQSVGWMPSVWDVRQDPAIASFFASLWTLFGNNPERTGLCPAFAEVIQAWIERHPGNALVPEDMLTSFDGTTLALPPAFTPKHRGKFRNYWLHTDQAYTRPGLRCIQGYMAMTPSRAEMKSGTLLAMLGSHKHHAAFAAAFPEAVPKSTGNWYRINAEQGAWCEEKGLHTVRIAHEPGDLILWDSRTLHCGGEPGICGENLRAIVYTCYMPRALTVLSKDGDYKGYKEATRVLSSRINAFREGRVSSHWPVAGFKMTAKIPRTYNAAKKPRSVVVTDTATLRVTTLGRRLIGFVVASKFQCERLSHGVKLKTRTVPKLCDNEDRKNVKQESCDGDAKRRKLTVADL